METKQRGSPKGQDGILRQSNECTKHKNIIKILAYSREGFEIDTGLTSFVHPNQLPTSTIFGNVALNPIIRMLSQTESLKLGLKTLETHTSIDYLDFVLSL
jgi:hypothetical protein